MSNIDVPGRRSGDHFGIDYVVDRLTKAVDDLGASIIAMATKAEVAAMLLKIDEKADLADFEKIDQRLTRIERNQLPPWVLGLGVIVVTIALHFWKAG